MARSVRPSRFVVAAVVVALVALGLSGCVADPPPTIGTVTPGNAQAVVSWQPPLAAPAPITGYVVTPWIGFTRQPPVVFNSPATTETVTGLTNGVTYTFTVHAVNAHGDDSAESGMSNSVTPVSAMGLELPVSDPVYGPNLHNQSYAQAAAFDGTNYLVAWVDQRNSSNGELWGARVAPDGTVLDVAGIWIAPGGAAPDVAFDGTDYLVVWATSYGVAAVRVSTSGVVLDQTPIQITTSFSTVTTPRVSAGNGSSLVVWGACSPSECPNAPVDNDVLGARIASDGTVLDPSAVTIGSALNAGVPDVAFDGTNYLVAFGHLTTSSPVRYDIAARQVSGAGVPLSGQFDITWSGLAHFASPSLSFDGTNFFVVWADYPAYVGGRVRGTRISPNPLGLLDPSGFDISTAQGQGIPAVTFDGTNTLVAWYDYSGFAVGTMRVRRIDGTGTPVDPSPIPVPGVTGQGPALAAGGGQVLFAFAASPSPSTSPTTVIDAVRIDGGSILDNPPFAVSTQASEQTASAIASTPNGSFVAWEDGRSNDVYGARLQGGSMLDGTGIPISTAPSGQADGPEAVASDGTGYFVVWSRFGLYGTYGTDLYGARVTADGVVLDPGGIQITNTPNTVDGPASVAFDGTNYLVVWDGTGQQSQSGVSVARVSTNGTVLDPGGVVLTTTNGEARPTVAFGGGCYFVAWQTKDIYGQGPYFAAERLGTDLTVLDPAPLSIFHSSPSETLPQVAFNGTDFLVVWQKATGPSDIGGTRVTPGGGILDYWGGLTISAAPNAQTAPHIAANGDGHFLVVWDDHRAANPNAFDIYGARVSDAGAVLDPSGVAIANTLQGLSGFSFGPRVAPNAGTGSWEVTYTRWAPDPPYGSNRVFHRSVNLLN